MFAKIHAQQPSRIQSVFSEQTKSLLHQEESHQQDNVSNYAIDFDEGIIVFEYEQSIQVRSYQNTTTSFDIDLKSIKTTQSCLHIHHLRCKNQSQTKYSTFLLTFHDCLLLLAINSTTIPNQINQSKSTYSHLSLIPSTSFKSNTIPKYRLSQFAIFDQFTQLLPTTSNFIHVISQRQVFELRRYEVLIDQEQNLNLNETKTFKNLKLCLKKQEANESNSFQELKMSYKSIQSNYLFVSSFIFDPHQTQILYAFNLNQDVSIDNEVEFTYAEEIFDLGLKSQHHLLREFIILDEINQINTIKYSLAIVMYQVKDEVEISIINLHHPAIPIKTFSYQFLSFHYVWNSFLYFKQIDRGNQFSLEHLSILAIARTSLQHPQSTQLVLFSISSHPPHHQLILDHFTFQQEILQIHSSFNQSNLMPGFLVQTSTGKLIDIKLISKKQLYQKIMQEIEPEFKLINTILELLE